MKAIQRSDLFNRIANGCQRSRRVSLLALDRVEGPVLIDEIQLKFELYPKRFGFEFKYTDSPMTTRSMHIPLEDLILDPLYFVHPGKDSFPMQE